MALDKVQFETNVPQEMALKYATGKPVVSQIDGAQQFMFSTTDGRVFFAAEFVAEKITALQLAPGECFSMCKREVRNGSGKPRIEWVVEKLNGAPRQTPQVTGRTTNSTTPATSKQEPLPIDMAMQMFLLASGRATRQAEELLGKEGASIRFDSRDVAAIATSMFIEVSKSGWNSWTYPTGSIAPAAESAPVKSSETVPELPVRGSKQAAQTVAAAKIEELERKQPQSEQITLQGRQAITEYFARIREKVGEGLYHQELKLAGVQKPEQFRYLNDAQNCYNRMLLIAQKEAAC